MDANRVGHALKGLEELSVYMKRSQREILSPDVTQRWAVAMDSYVDVIRKELEIDRSNIPGLDDLG